MSLPRPEDPHQNHDKPPQPPRPTPAAENSVPQPEVSHPSSETAPDTANLAPPDTTDEQLQYRALGGASLRPTFLRSADKSASETSASDEQPSEKQPPSEPAKAPSPVPATTPEEAALPKVTDSKGPVDPPKPPTVPGAGEHEGEGEGPIDFGRFMRNAWIHPPTDEDLNVAGSVCDRAIEATAMRQPELTFSHNDLDTVILSKALPGQQLDILVHGSEILVSELNFKQSSPDKPEPHSQINHTYGREELPDGSGCVYTYESETRSDDYMGSARRAVGPEEAAMVEKLLATAEPAAYSFVEVGDHYNLLTQESPIGGQHATRAATQLGDKIASLFTHHSEDYDPQNAQAQRITVQRVEDVSYLEEYGPTDIAQVEVTIGTEHLIDGKPILWNAYDESDHRLLGVAPNLTNTHDPEGLTPFIHTRALLPVIPAFELEYRSDLARRDPDFPQNAPLRNVEEYVVRVVGGKAVMQRSSEIFLGDRSMAVVVAKPIPISSFEVAMMQHLAMNPRFGVLAFERQHAYRKQQETEK